MWNGYGVCSNLASSGEAPPASQNHFNHCIYLQVFAVNVHRAVLRGVGINPRNAHLKNFQRFQHNSAVAVIHNVIITILFSPKAFCDTQKVLKLRL